ncbi:SnoaL-like polyketide cyclase [Roseivivax jejudonensis]|uniref:SnoaL-like polyketide cyclase n=1 Tax=Roseivivax jejudonensis TaxID=1529041 RepID=A0A1X6YFB1_9RHOB|nr:ester cyclase [Roseivivax jejudonensis]SLN19724.1 SnoaL-like polyketide cyclase [Roseivivax jejudonensis]
MLVTDQRASLHAGLSAMLRAPDAEFDASVARIFSESCRVHLSAPFYPLDGTEALIAGFLRPLRTAFEGIHRRDEIFIAGDNRRDTGGHWAASVAHYVGNFRAPFAGIRPSGRLAFLRAGEFYRIEGGRVTEARLILDLPDLMRQAGRMPFPQELGTEMLFPSPATHDGVLPQTGSGAESLDVVERMLSDLHAYDPQTFESAAQTGASGAWADDMLWYGPSGIGANYRWSGFVKDHRAPFLTAFPDRKGGNHYCRIGDGNYAAVSGWPSMTMTHLGDYLGVPATHRALTLRVMDFYRIAGGRIAENWVLLDYLDLFAQMGIDLVARSNAME